MSKNTFVGKLHLSRGSSKREAVIRLILAAATIVLAALILAIQSPLPSNIGKIDFRAYWSASSLLRQGLNPSDPALIYRVERELTGWRESYPEMTWNPPWLLVLLTPLTVLGFDRAAWWWMLINIALVFVSAIVLWRFDAAKERTSRREWIGPLVAFAYSPTLIALIAGQVNILVLAGMVAYLFFRLRSHGTMAGIALALTTVKPQLVYITVPILVLDWLSQRKWRPVAAFALTLILLTGLALALRPGLVFEYGKTMGAAQLLEWETPTLGGVLHLTLGWGWAKLMGLAVLPVCVLAWWRSRSAWDVRTLVDITVLLSVITAPFGWSYDFVMLLLPLSRIVAWAADGALRASEAVGLAVVLVGADVLMYVQRVETPSEVYYAWVPFVVILAYAYVWRAHRALRPVQTIAIPA